MLRSATSKMESLVSFLDTLEKEHHESRVPGDVLMHTRDKLNIINAKLGKLQETFMGRYRWRWTSFIFFFVSSVYFNLKEVDAAVEPLHIHLELSNLGFKSIEMQQGVLETLNEVQTELYALLHAAVSTRLFLHAMDSEDAESVFTKVRSRRSNPDGIAMRLESEDHVVPTLRSIPHELFKLARPIRYRKLHNAHFALPAVETGWSEI